VKIGKREERQGGELQARIPEKTRNWKRPAKKNRRPAREGGVNCSDSGKARFLKPGGSQKPLCVQTMEKKPGGKKREQRPPPRIGESTSPQIVPASLKRKNP